MRRLNEIDTVVRVDASHARWTFTYPVDALIDVSGFDMNTASPTAATLAADNSSALVTYDAPISVGDRWSISGDAVEWFFELGNVPQTGRVL